MSRIEDWVQMAELDLRGARAALKEGVANIVCFLSHQAVEKVLKAVLLKNGGETPKIHVLIELLDRIGMSGIKNKVKYLDQFYIPTRYPDTLPGSLAEGLPSMEDAKKALGYAEEMVELMKDRLKGK